MINVVVVQAMSPADAADVLVVEAVRLCDAGEVMALLSLLREVAPSQYSDVPHARIKWAVALSGELSKKPEWQRVLGIVDEKRTDGHHFPEGKGGNDEEKNAAEPEI